MELLQNRRYKPGEIPERYFHEIRILIEGIIDVCQEGEISVYEADHVIHEELLSCLDYKDELWKKLYNLENGIQEPKVETYSSLFSPEELADLEVIGRKWDIEDMEKALDDMEGYNNFIIEAQEKLDKIYDGADYNKKRKAKLKSQIIRDGLKLPLGKIDQPQVINKDLGDRFINNLIIVFPEFEKDFPLLIKNEYLEKTKTGLRWKKSKQSLAEYFNDIKPEKWKEMNWKPIENAFGEKGLKSSLSRNGNAFKDKSKDFKRWLEIKKSWVNEFTDK